MTRPIQTLDGYIMRYHEARASWEVVFDRNSNGADDCIEWTALEKAEYDIAAYQCRSLGDAQKKARFFLELKDGIDTLGMTVTGTGELLLAFFLRSLISEQPVDNGDSGENRT